jgi:hypothetical protein
MRLFSKAGRSREKYDRVFRIGKGCRSKQVTLNGDFIEKPFTVVYYNIERVSETSRAWNNFMSRWAVWRPEYDGAPSQSGKGNFMTKTMDGSGLSVV